MRAFIVSFLAAIPSSAFALPTGDAEHLSEIVHRAIHPRCGPVSAYYGQTPADWMNHNVDSWFNDWWNAHLSSITAGGSGFAGVWGLWAIGNPDWTCRDDGSDSNCDFDPCDNRVLNDKGDDIREAYYVLESITRLHSYFTGLNEAFEVSAIFAALSKDSWATTFYKDKDVKSVGILREILNAVGAIIGIGSAFAGLAGSGAGAAGSALSALFTGGVGAAAPLIGQHQDDTFQKSADLGGILGQIVIGAMKSYTSANNILMAGGNYGNTGDIRTYVNGGLFVNFPGVDKNGVINAMSNLLIGQAINALWRTQKVFIMGGGACGDNQGIGSGPQAASVCRNGQAWYLYYWQENDVVSTTSHQWGWVNSPPGADQLGQGDYIGVSVQDIINSSLDSYNVAGYNYTADTATQRAQSALESQWANPGAQGPSWEGTFTIPVCDVSAILGANLYDGQFILQDYGHDSRPVWCGPICSNNPDQTKAFIAAAQMTNFQSPKHLCPHGSAPY
ncbi:MAG: hypothetical protein Q9195_005254 [Heterodermia aff. obscurata]